MVVEMTEVKGVATVVTAVVKAVKGVPNKNIVWPYTQIAQIFDTPANLSRQFQKCIGIRISLNLGYLNEKMYN